MLMTITKTSSKGNICYLQSGGPTSVINASFLGLLQAKKELLNDSKLYVSHFGVTGLLNGHLEEVIEAKLPNLNVRPGAYFGSLRKKLPESNDSSEAKKIVSTLKKYNIRYLLLNGGNDSMDSVKKISDYLKHSDYACQVAGIPKTIDNDLAVSDHTPGYGSSAKFIANATLAIAIDDQSYEKGRINVIETMGRDCGYLAASSYLSSLKGYAPDFIYVPEVLFDVILAKKKAEEKYMKTGHCLVVVSEGIRDKDNNFVAANKQSDAFGHTQMGGVASYLASLFMDDGYKTRAIEISLMQRAGSFVSSKTDIDEAKQVGYQALKEMTLGKSGFMVIIKRVSDKPYQVRYDTCPVEKIADIAVPLKKEYISSSLDNITPAFIDYVLPLIQGEEKDTFKDGLLNI